MEPLRADPMEEDGGGDLQAPADGARMTQPVSEPNFENPVVEQARRNLARKPLPFLARGKAPSAAMDRAKNLKFKLANARTPQGFGRADLPSAAPLEQPAQAAAAAAEDIEDIGSRLRRKPEPEEDDDDLPRLDEAGLNPPAAGGLSVAEEEDDLPPLCPMDPLPAGEVESIPPSAPGQPDEPQQAQPAQLRQEEGMVHSTHAPEVAASPPPAAEAPASSPAREGRGGPPEGAPPAAEEGARPLVEGSERGGAAGREAPPAAQEEQPERVMPRVMPRVVRAPAPFAKASSPMEARRLAALERARAKAADLVAARGQSAVEESLADAPVPSEQPPRVEEAHEGAARGGEPTVPAEEVPVPEPQQVMPRIMPSTRPAAPAAKAGNPMEARRLAALERARAKAKEFAAARAQGGGGAKESAPAESPAKESAAREDAVKEDVANEGLAKEDMPKGGAAKVNLADGESEPEVMSDDSEAPLPPLVTNGRHVQFQPPSRPPPPQQGKGEPDEDIEEVVTEGVRSEAIVQRAKRTGAEASAAGTDDVPASSAKEPFPEEHKAAAAKLAEARSKGGGGAEEARALLAVAELHLAGGRYGEATKCAEQAWTLFDEGRDDEEQANGEAEAERLIIRADVEEERIEGARETALEHLGHFRKAGFARAEATIRLALAEVYLASDRAKVALRTALEALEACRKLRHQPGIAAALQMTTRARLELRTPYDLKKALAEGEEALSFFRVVGEAKEEAATLLYISQAHRHRQAVEEAVSNADSAVSLSRASGQKKSEAAALREVASMLIEMKEDLTIALQTAEEAVELCDEIGDPIGEILSRHLCSAVHLAQNRPEDALQMLQKSLALARELGDRRHIGSTLEAILHLHESTGEMEKALEALEQEVALAKECGDNQRVMASFQRLAPVQLLMGKEDQALRSAEEAISLMGKAGGKLHGWAWQLAAEVHVAMKSQDKALEAAAKAREHLSEESETRSIVDTWRLEMGLRFEAGDLDAALKGRLMERKAFKDAGWRDEEADALLSTSELVLHLQGPKEAIKVTKEAIALYQENDDKMGEAKAVLQLASIQKAFKSHTDALGSTRSARKLFQQLGDVDGEAAALQAEASVYLDNGNFDEALKRVTEGRAQCKKEGEKLSEASALQEVLQVHLARVARDAESSSRQPNSQAAKDAIPVATELVSLYQELGNTSSQVQVLVQMSGLHLMCQQTQEAMQMAEEALQLSLKVDQANEVSISCIALAEAKIAAESYEEAAELAEQAEQLFLQVGDQAKVDQAQQIAREAKDLLAAPPKRVAHFPPQGPGKAHDFRQRDLETQQSWMKTGRMSKSGKEEQTGPTNKKVFSWHQGQLQEPKPDVEPPTKNTFDVPKVRADQPKVGRAADPKFVADPELKTVLQSVRPDWTSRDIQLVLEKLSKIDITSKPELLRQLRRDGTAGMNRKLKSAGYSVLQATTCDRLARLTLDAPETDE